jgi:hypothetical protein
MEILLKNPSCDLPVEWSCNRLGQGGPVTFTVAGPGCGWQKLRPETKSLILQDLSSS